MPRKFEIQLKSWVPLVIESFLTYDTLNTFEIIKHSGSPLRILGTQGQVDEIISVLDFLVKGRFLLSKEDGKRTYFGIQFDNYIYEPKDSFKLLLEQSVQRTTTENRSAGDLIHSVKIENISNTINIFNFNLSFVMEKLLEVKAGFINL